MKENIIEDLTDKEKELLESDIRKNKFKILTKFLKSDKYKDLIKMYITKWKLLLEEIYLEIDKRRKGWFCKATRSDLDKTLSFYDFQVELANDIGKDSEAELILKEDLLKNAEDTYSHVLNKVEELYDVPSYSELDMLKYRKKEYLLIEDRLETMVSFYMEEKNEISNPNPYEESDSLV